MLSQVEEYEKPFIGESLCAKIGGGPLRKRC